MLLEEMLLIAFICYKHFESSSTVEFDMVGLEKKSGKALVGWKRHQHRCHYIYVQMLHF